MTATSTWQDVLAGRVPWSVTLGDCRDVLREMPDASVHAVVTDPPYELGFMGKGWDASGIANDVTMWREVLRVLKPGGHLLSFGGTRTYHRMACAIEDAGFEIRDCLAWMYGSGFPKSLDVSKAIDAAAGAAREVVGSRTCSAKGIRGAEERSGPAAGSYGNAREAPITLPATEDAQRWDGWGTALKPAFEPIVLARKPLERTVAKNVLEHGTGGLNVDGCRIGTSKRVPGSLPQRGGAFEQGGWGGGEALAGASGHDPDVGRWPANVALTHHEDCRLVGERPVASNGNYPRRGGASGMFAEDGGGLHGYERAAPRTTRGEVVDVHECHPDCPVRMLDEQTGWLTSGLMLAGTPRGRQGAVYERGLSGQPMGSDTRADSGGASRFFYCSKTSREEREAGCSGLQARQVDETRDEDAPGANNPRNRGGRSVRNHHPTVKPIALMRWLCRLVTPPGGIVADPFTGSGTTGGAARLENLRFIGMELGDEYVPIAVARIAHADAQSFQESLFATEGA